MLAEILDHKRGEVAHRKKQVPLPMLLEGVEPTWRGKLSTVLSSPHVSFILECKKASPSRGVIREDFDPVEIARVYRKTASAISVLTDRRFFQGSFEILAKVRAEVDVPVLCKDFILEPYQVIEARLHGADAVLLMLSVLDDKAYASCAAAAREYGMSCLTEVHDEAELERAVRLGAEVIGINNRDLKTLNIDLSTTERLAPLIPKDRVIVSESGVMSHGDVRRLGSHVDAFLIGSSLMRRPDLARAANALRVGRVKVCGLTRVEDAEAAYRFGASYGGVIFAPESPRRVSLEAAQRIREAVPDLPLVGVFVNEDADVIAMACSELELAAVQLHGEETIDEIASVRARVGPKVQIWKAHRVTEAKLPDASALGVDRVLLETHSAEMRGGTGQTFDWSVVENSLAKQSYVLAGGLNPSNASAAASLGVDVLDVNSGVERAPGIKSHEKLERFFDALRVPSRQHERGNR